MFDTIVESVKTPIIRTKLSKQSAINMIERFDPWISSDYHLLREYFYFNANNSPNKQVKEYAEKTMNTIKTHNRFVKKNDLFLFLGDMCESELKMKKDVQDIFKSTMKKLNGTAILVLGNNDTMKDEFYYQCGFSYVSHEPLICENLKIIFSHCPYDIVDSMFDIDWINVHGHIHGSRNYWNMSWRRHADVYPGMKCNQGRPLKLREIRSNYEKGYYSGKSSCRQQIC